MRAALSAFVLVLLHLNLVAQESASVMSYNVLNFPTGNLAGREDTLRKLINYVQPDLFLIQELKNDSGLQLILENSFSDLPSTYAASTYVPQQSNPSSGWKLQQALIYNSDMLGLAEESYLVTDVRDLNKFKMFYRDPDLNLGADTVFFYVFVVHLKSSQGGSNEAARLAMAETLTQHFELLPQNSSVIVAGDFNVYTSLELAYQELIDTSNSIVLRDPIDTPGDWHSFSYPNKEVLTQSTRASAIFGDGAGGGIDDRFDFVLLSDDMFNELNHVVYQAGSYHAMGNTGNCYNQSITACDDGVWPDTVLNSLYYMSDHLPIVLNLEFASSLVSIDQKERYEARIWNGGNNIQGTGFSGEDVRITLYDLTGRLIQSSTEPLINGAFSTSVFQETSGIYVLQAVSEGGSSTLKVKW